MNQLGNARSDRLQHLGSPRALQRQQRLLPHVIDGYVGQAPLQIVDVAVLGRAVDDDVEIVAAAGGHQVVDDPAVLVEQQRISGFMSLSSLKSPGSTVSRRCVHGTAVDPELAHVADVEQAGILTRPKVLGHDAFVLDRHLVAGERDHPAALGAVPLVKRQFLERCSARCLRHLADRRYGSPRARVLVGGTVVDFSAHIARCDGRDGLDLVRSFRRRPRLSLAPESFAAFGGPRRRKRRTLSRLSRRARSLGLRDSGGGCSFGAAPTPWRTANSPARPSGGRTPPETGGALAAREAQVQRGFRQRSARGVVAELLLGQLEADEMLEGRIGNCGADRRIGQRIDRRLVSPALRGLVRVARTTRQSRGRTLTRIVAWARSGRARSLRGSSARSGRLAWRDVRAALQRDVEIGQDDLPRRGLRRGAAQPRRRSTVEMTSLPVVPAGRADVGDRRGHVDRPRVRAVARRVEQSDVAGPGRDPSNRASAAPA